MNYSYIITKHQEIKKAVRYGTPIKILVVVGRETHKEIKHWTKEDAYSLCTLLW